MNFRRIIAYVSVLAALAMPMAMAQSVPNLINSTAEGGDIDPEDIGGSYGRAGRD
jgi:hypothetical protein